MVECLVHWLAGLRLFSVWHPCKAAVLKAPWVSWCMKAQQLCTQKPWKWVWSFGDRRWMVCFPSLWIQTLVRDARRWVWCLIFRLTVNLFNISKSILFFGNILKKYYVVCTLFVLVLFRSLEYLRLISCSTVLIFQHTQQKQETPRTTWNQCLLWRQHDTSFHLASPMQPSQHMTVCSIHLKTIKGMQIKSTPL